MPNRTTTDTPAVRADRCSRITRTIARILRRDVFADDALAHHVAGKVAAGLIDEHGGESLYVPTADRRAGATDHEAIEASLRAALTPEQIATRGQAPSEVIGQVAAQHGVHHATAYRVLQRMRREAA